MFDNLIYSINGPVVTVKDTADFSMLEMVYVGNKRLIGEIIAISSHSTTIQVYESTTGLSPGEPVISTGMPLCATLGPGIISNIFDGIQRPLEDIAKISGYYIRQGLDIPPLDTKKLWDVTVLTRVGDHLSGGQIYASCPETLLVEHRCMLHPDMSGEVLWVAENGQYTINDPIAKIKDSHGKEITLTLCHRWPVRTPRPVRERLSITMPLITGQRIIDTLFPIAKGGTAAVPGGFGTGKDHDPAPACQVVRCRYYRLCGLRRTRQRDDPGTGRVHAIDRPKIESTLDGKNGAHCQHLQYACRRQRSVHLHGHHPG